MGVRAKRFSEFGLTLEIFEGVVTTKDLVAHYEETESFAARRWLSWFAPDADFSSLSVEVTADMKFRLDEQFTSLFGDQPVAIALVSGEGENPPLLDVWRSYFGSDRHPVVLFDSVSGACAWLGLPDAAREAVDEALRAGAA